jgi:GntR family transcriptional regulator
LPLWAQLQAVLTAQLEAGEFASAFPGELELMARFGVSRFTVREALRRLRADGVVLAQRGRRPQLAASAEIRQPLGALYSLFSSVEAAGLQQRSMVRVLDIRADGVVAARLGLEESTPLLYLERLRLADEAPLALDRVWLPARLAAPLLESDFSHTSLYAELDALVGLRLSAGREEIQAVVPTLAERNLLQLPANTAAFAIERLACAAGEFVEWRHTLVRGDRFSLTADFSAVAGYRLGVAGRVEPPRTRR